MSDIVQKLWGFCHVLRHDGIDYGDYVEQLTYLLFLKMADERGVQLPKGCSWPELEAYSGVELLDHYANMLRTLGKQTGILGDIFAQSMPRFSNPVNLKKLVSLIDETDWTGLDKDVKAEAFEGLLEKAASEGKKGAGQFFTPRPLIQSICDVMKPDPRPSSDINIYDPALGTAGFLVCAYEWLLDQTKGAFDRDVAKRIKMKTYYGQELVPRPRRLALMNMFLHGIEPIIRLGDTIYEAPTGDRYSVVLSNPPFGSKGASQMPDREDFTIETSNKQLNFIQHILTVLKPGGRAAVVLPDNCLFADQAGEVFEILTMDCNLHTVLRLPRGTFTPYSQGVKANVVFFTKGYATENTWIYDCRSNVPGITKKDRPLTRQHFAEFVACYGTDPDGRSPRKPKQSKDDRWRSFHITEVKDRDFKLDSFKWIKDDSLEDADELPEPEELAADAIAELEGAVGELNAVAGIFGERELSDPAANIIDPPDAPTHVPRGWIVARLGDLGAWGSGGTPSKSKSEYWSSGAIPWVSPKDMKRWRIDDSIDHLTQNAVDETGLRLLPVGSVIFVVRGMILAHTFPVGILTRPVTINQDMRSLTPHDSIDSEFLLLTLQRQSAAILHVVREATHGTLRLESDTLRAWPCLIPPMAEQKRIVAKVDEVLARVTAARERLEKVPTILKRFRQSVLAAACAGRLTADWRPKDVVGKSDAEKGLPSTWEASTVDEVIETLKYGTSQKCDYGGKGVAVLRIPNIGDGTINRTDLKYAELEKRELDELRLRAGDVLMIRSNGSVSLLGKAALVGPADEGSAYAGYLMRLRPNRKKVLPEYLNMVLGGFDVRLQIELPARSTSGVNNINSDEVKALPINVPPLDEQAEIVRRMTNVQAFIHKIGMKVATGTMRADKLVQATLAKAFRGELMPTEADLAEREGRDYDTGESLLSRVRQQGAAAGKLSIEKMRPQVAVETRIAVSLFPESKADGTNKLVKSLSVLKRHWKLATKTTTPPKALLQRAFKSVCGQSSPDKVVADPVLHRAFVAECRTLGLKNPEYDLCFALLNLRKASGLKGLGSTREPLRHQWRYAGASEIAARVLNWRHGLSLDRMLCDLSYEDEFEQVASNITPGFKSFQYRWAALGLRKQGKHASQTVVERLRWSDPVSFAAVDKLPDEEGVYALHDPEGCVFVAGADDIKASAASQSGIGGQTLFDENLWKPDPSRLVWKYAVAEVGSTARQVIVNSLVARFEPILNVVRVA